MFFQVNCFISGLELGSAPESYSIHYYCLDKHHHDVTSLFKAVGKNKQRFIQSAFICA